MRPQFLKRYVIFFILLLGCLVFAYAQTADSVIVNQLRKEGITFSCNNSVTLLTSGQEKFDDLFKAIRQARSSIHLEYFNFRNDSIANLLFNLLEEKAQEGVEVRALFDGFGNDSNNRPLRRKQIQDIRRRGIEIYEFDPIRFPFVNHIFHRDHRKIVVIDGQIAYTGGMNVADYYIKGTRVVGTWNDMHCRLEGNEVNSLQRIFLRMWNKTTHQNIQGAQYYRGGLSDGHFIGLKPDTCNTAGHKMVGIINREPHTSNTIIRRFYTDAINGAKDSIKLINPYLTLNATLKRALRRAVKRGVKVEIMVFIILKSLWLMGDSALSVVPISMPEVSISTMKRMPSSSIVVLRLNFRISSIAIKRRAFFSPKRRGIVSAVRGRSLSVGLPIFLLHSCDVVKVYHLISTRLKG